MADEQEVQKPKNRKLAVTRETMLAMLLGFVVAAYFKVGADLFGMFVLGLAGKDAGFMWGNAKEHAATVEAAKHGVAQ